jgi:hypothetical protein
MFWLEEEPPPNFHLARHCARARKHRPPHPPGVQHTTRTSTSPPYDPRNIPLDHSTHNSPRVHPPSDNESSSAAIALHNHSINPPPSIYRPTAYRYIIEQCSAARVWWQVRQEGPPSVSCALFARACSAVRISGRAWILARFSPPLSQHDLQSSILSPAARGPHSPTRPPLEFHFDSSPRTPPPLPPPRRTTTTGPASSLGSPALPLPRPPRRPPPRPHPRAAPPSASRT